MVLQLPPNLPVGFRFHPTDVELVTSYLKPKILGKAYDVDAIAEVNLCELEPWELPLKSNIEMHNDRSWWFLCRRDYVNQSSNRSKRSTKTGFWKITGKERKIKDENTKVCIGRKRTLVFHTGPTPGRRTNWVMQEIYLDPDTFTIPTQTAAYVICRLKKKTDENIETPEGEVVPNLKHQVSPHSTQSVNREMPIDLEFDSGPLESGLTQDDIRWILSDEQEGTIIAAADMSDESPEDFADRCLVDDVDETFGFTDNCGMQSLKRLYFGDGPAGSDTDAEGANTPYFQTAESSGYLYSNANSKKVRQMRMSKMRSETMQTSVATQHFVEEQTVSPTKESSSHSMPSVTQCPKPIVCPKGIHHKQIQIEKNKSSSSSSSSSSPVTKSTVKAEEPQKCVCRKLSSVKDKEYRDNGKVGEKGKSKSLTSSWSSVVTFVDASTLSMSGSRSLVEYWLNVVFGSVLFIIFVRELVIFGGW